jgi:hypothetical protein
MRLLLTALTVLSLAVSARAGGNLLKNSSFESELGAEDWGRVWGWFSREETGKPPDGKMAGFIRGGTDPEIGAIQFVEKLKPGSIYRLSAKFRTEDGVAAKAYRFKLEFVDFNNDVISAEICELTDMVKDMWVMRAVIATAPAETVSGQVVFEGTGITGPGSVGSDGWRLEEITP